METYFDISETTNIDELPNYVSEFGEIYEKNANEFFKLLKNVTPENAENICRHFNEYSNKFTMLPIFWDLWIKSKRETSRSDVLLKSQRHFSINGFRFHIYFFCCIHNELDKCSLVDVYKNKFECGQSLLRILIKINYNFIFDHFLQTLKYPHANLEENLHYCLAFSKSPCTLKLLQFYTKSSKLYQDLISVFENEEKWFEILKQIYDIDRIVEEIENRITNEPANQKLWKILINFLHESKLNVLPVYKRYCRLFLDDKEMRKMYRKAIGNFSRDYQKKWWIDLIEIERDFESEESALELLKSIIQNEFLQFNIDFLENSFNENFQVFKNVSKIKDTEIIFMLKKSDELPYIPYQNITSLYSTIFNFSIPQSFCFPSFLINYTIKQQNSYNLQNLKMSCKFFLYKIKANYCHQFIFENDKNAKCNIAYYSKQSAFLNRSAARQGFKNLCLTNSVIFHRIDHLVGTGFLGKYIFPKLYNCGIRYISITNQNLEYSEFLFFTSSGKVESLFLHNCNIRENRVTVSIKKILSLIPKASFIELNYDLWPSFWPFKNLLKYKHPVSFKHFTISGIKTSLTSSNINHFYIFMMNNANKDSRFSVGFRFDNITMTETFKNQMAELLEPCWIIDAKRDFLTFKHKVIENKSHYPIQATVDQDVAFSRYNLVNQGKKQA